MIRTGDEYRESIRDGREVWVDGEKVADVTKHRSLKPIIDARARIYDMAHDPRTRDVMSYLDTETNERCPIGAKLAADAGGLARQAHRRRHGDG